MSDISIFNDKINIEIIDPGVVIRMCSFVKGTLGKRDDLVNKHAIKRQFDNLVKEFVDERIPKDERFPGAISISKRESNDGINNNSRCKSRRPIQYKSQSRKSYS